MKNQTTNKKSVLEIVNERIIEKLEKGVNPWRKPWNYPGVKANPNVIACNYISNKAYQGVNAFLLEPGYYLTFKQIQQIGGKLKKGSKGEMVIYSAPTKPYKVKDEVVKPDGTIETVESIRKGFILKYYMVFNLKDVEDYREIKRRDDEVKGLYATKTAEEVDLIIEDYCKRAKLSFTSQLQDRAYYQPLTHKVFIPEAKQFKDLAEYYSTAFHELGHSTGHSTLLNRGLDEAVSFGDTSYAKEELIAEITSAYCCNYLGVASDASDSNSVAYLKSWADHLKGNTASWFILNAMTKATDAFKLIMNIQEQEENTEEVDA